MPRCVKVGGRAGSCRSLAVYCLATDRTGCLAWVSFTFTCILHRAFPAHGHSPCASCKSLSYPVPIIFTHPFLSPVVIPILLVCPPPSVCPCSCVTPPTKDPRCNLCRFDDPSSAHLSAACSRAATPTTSDHTQPRHSHIPHTTLCEAYHRHSRHRRTLKADCLVLESAQ